MKGAYMEWTFWIVFSWVFCLVLNVYFGLKLEPESGISALALFLVLESNQEAGK